MRGEARAGLSKLKVAAFGGDSWALSRPVFVVALPADLLGHIGESSEGGRRVGRRLRRPEEERREREGEPAGTDEPAADSTTPPAPESPGQDPR